MERMEQPTSRHNLENKNPHPTNGAGELFEIRNPQSAIRSTRLVRIGLSATQRPIEEVARFLVGAGNLRPDGSPDCTVIDSGHVRRLDLGVELPESPLQAVMSNEVWD